MRNARRENFLSKGIAKGGFVCYTANRKIGGAMEVAHLADVFISYHTKSCGKLARQIVSVLEPQGISCWFAERDMPPGANFADYVPKEIKTCRIFLILLNQESTHSDHVASEVGLAFGRHNMDKSISILPYQIGNVVLPDWMKYYLVHIQITKGASTTEESIGKLAEQIRRILGGDAAQENATSSKRQQTDEKPRNYPSEDILDSGICGEKASWTLYKDGKMVISGVGRIANYRFFARLFSPYVNTPWWNCRNQIVSLTIEEGITSVGEYAFYACHSLNNVSFPTSVTAIGHSAFSGSSIKNVNFPDSLRYIGARAFHGAQMTELTIPDSITTIDVGTFEECHNLASLTIPNSVITIKRWAFCNCPKLKTVILPLGVQISWLGAFSEDTVLIRRTT